MSNLREYQNRIADIAKRSKAVLGWASTAQFGTDNQFIKDDAARAAPVERENPAACRPDGRLSADPSRLAGSRHARLPEAGCGWMHIKCKMEQCSAAVQRSGPTSAPPP